MAGGKVFNTWRGPGDTYDRGLNMSVISANMTSRYLPYRDKGNAHIVSAPGGQNASGDSWEKHHAGITHAGVKSAALPGG